MAPAGKRRLLRSSGEAAEEEKTKQPRHGHEHHRHYKYTARALQDPEEKDVVFRLQTPSASGLPMDKAGEGSYAATVLGISARPAPGKVRFSLKLSLQFPRAQDGVVSKIFENAFYSDSTLEKIGRKCNDFSLLTLKAWPYFNQVPALRLKVADPNFDTVALELTLPPFTAVDTDDPIFWKALEFPPEFVDHHVADSGEDRYGITNRTSSVLVVTTGGLHEKDDPESLYMAANQGDPPSYWRLNVAARILTDLLTQTLQEEKPLDGDAAANSIAHLLHAGLQVLGLSPGHVLSVDLLTRGQVTINNLRFAGGENGGRVLQLSVLLSPAFWECFYTHDPTLVFPGNDIRTFTLVFKTPPAPDPLSGHFPLHLVASSQVPAHHFVHGHGWTSMLGILLDEKTVAGRKEWIRLTPGLNEIRLRLLDRWAKPVLVPSVTEFILYLELVDLF